MGAHKHNPVADGYVGGASPEALPPLVIGCQLVCQAVPSNDWMKANPPDPDTGERPKCPPDSGEVVFVITGRVLVPSVLVHRDQWKYAEAPVMEVARVSYATFMAHMENGNPGFLEAIKSLAPQILLPAGN